MKQLIRKDEGFNKRIELFRCLRDDGLGGVWFEMATWNVRWVDGEKVLSSVGEVLTMARTESGAETEFNILCNRELA